MGVEGEGEGISHLGTDVIIHWGGRTEKAWWMVEAGRWAQFWSWWVWSARISKQSLVIQNIGKKCKWKNHMHISNAETCHKRCVKHQRLSCKVENVKGSWQKRSDTWVECHIWFQNLQFLINWVPDKCLPNK